MRTSTKLCWIATLCAFVSISVLVMSSLGQFPLGFFSVDPVNNKIATGALGLSPIFVAAILLEFSDRLDRKEREAKRIEDERLWREWKFRSVRVVKETTAPEHHFRSTGGSSGRGTEC